MQYSDLEKQLEKQLKLTDGRLRNLRETHNVNQTPNINKQTVQQYQHTNSNYKNQLKFNEKMSSPIKNKNESPTNQKIELNYDNFIKQSQIVQQLQMQPPQLQLIGNQQHKLNQQLSEPTLLNSQSLNQKFQQITQSNNVGQQFQLLQQMVNVVTTFKQQQDSELGKLNYELNLFQKLYQQLINQDISMTSSIVYQFLKDNKQNFTHADTEIYKKLLSCCQNTDEVLNFYESQFKYVESLKDTKNQLIKQIEQEKIKKINFNQQLKIKQKLLSDIQEISQPGGSEIDKEVKLLVKQVNNLENVLQQLNTDTNKMRQILQEKAQQ